MRIFLLKLITGILRLYVMSWGPILQYRFLRGLSIESGRSLELIKLQVFRREFLLFILPQWIIGTRCLTLRDLFFDHKPLVMKAWSENVDYTKDEVKVVPVWVQLKLDFKYWGLGVLEKIVRPLGTLVKVDAATSNRYKLNFARVLVEMGIEGDCPDSIQFINERDILVDIPVSYQWKPTLCGTCNKLGHSSAECRGKRMKQQNQKDQQQWVPKKVQTVQNGADNQNQKDQQQVVDAAGDNGKGKSEQKQDLATGSHTPLVDSDGFQLVIKSTKHSTVRKNIIFTGNGLGIIQEDKDQSQKGSVEENNESEKATEGVEILLVLMDGVLCWNVRGLNRVSKQDAIKCFLSSYVTGLICLLETKIKPKNLGAVYNKMFSGLCFTTNSSIAGDSRIMLAWNPHLFVVSVVLMTKQLIHCLIQPKGGGVPFYCSFIYAFNDHNERIPLWEDLRKCKVQFQGPWLLMGDLNCVLNLDEGLGSPVRLGEIKEIRYCMEECGLSDIPYKGNFYTWCNKHLDDSRVYSRIDRVMANDEWQEAYGCMIAQFLNADISDHCPAFVSTKSQCQGRNPSNSIGFGPLLLILKMSLRRYGVPMLLAVGCLGWLRS
ncbi:5'-3' exoribonuclease 2 [Bienertia sinuspersici]